MATLGPIPAALLGTKPDLLSNATDGTPNSKALLNTYIHNYFVGEGLVDLAKALRTSRLTFKADYLRTEDSIAGENKDDGSRVDGGLGMGNLGVAGTENFLPNWWCIFWDMWSAARQKEKTDTAAAQYLAHTQRLRQQQQNAALQQQAMVMPNITRFTNPMQPQIADLQKRGIAANGRMPAAMTNMNRIQQQMGGQNQMQRDGSELDMNGVPRGQSPMPGENAPSPKRQKFDNNGFNPQMGPNGRPQGLSGQPPNGSAPNANMLMAASFDPQNAMSPNSSQHNGMQRNARELYAQGMHQQTKSAMDGIPKAPMNLPGMPANSPMISTGPDGQMLPTEMFTANGQNAMRAGTMGASGNGGALADYQMQLMLLEQQNKKRLMMARQEQDVAQRDQGGIGPQGLMNQPGFGAPMSPRASRAGHSPGSNDPTKRGTPKMPLDSPLPDPSMGPGRASPAPGFDPSQMQGNLVPPFQMVGGPSGMMVRPTGQHPGGGPMPPQLEMMRQGVRMGNGAWPPGMHNPGQMMQPGQGVMQPGQVDNMQQRTNMPPPQGPANGRTQPPSPQQTAAAPPTPSQTNKAAPKNKKETKAKEKKATKKASTNAGINPTEVEQQDEVPPTPRTPNNPAASIIKGQPPNQSMQKPPAPPIVSMPTNPMSMMPQDNQMIATFGSLNDGSEMAPFGDFDDLLGQDNSDVLNGFDFDAFLHTEPVTGFDFDAPYLNGDTSLETMGE